MVQELRGAVPAKESKKKKSSRHHNENAAFLVSTNVRARSSVLEFHEPLLGVDHDEIFEQVARPGADALPRGVVEVEPAAADAAPQLGVVRLAVHVEGVVCLGVGVREGRVGQNVVVCCGGWGLS